MKNDETPEARVRRYRRRAAHLRQWADGFDGTREHAELLAIAEQYDRLADRFARAQIKMAEAG
jgi:hypothetical protein